MASNDITIKEVYNKVLHLEALYSNANEGNTLTRKRFAKISYIIISLIAFDIFISLLCLFTVLKHHVFGL